MSNVEEITGAPARVPPAVLLPGEDGAHVPPTRLMDIVCNAALAGTSGGVCLLLPSTTGIDHLVAVMSALSCLPDDTAKNAPQQIAKTFKDGQKVRVLPDGFVYKVAGAMPVGNEQGYWLLYLDAKKGSGNGKFAIWGDALRRLEPTERSRPLGPDRRQWSNLSPTSIDRLSGANTLGNHALLTNRVMLLGSKSDLEAFLEETRLLPLTLGGEEGFPPLAEELPWGSIAEDGAVYIEYPRSTPGDPLVAATRNFAAARKASEAAPAGSKIFVCRSLEGCLQNFETVSRIADRQRVILLAEASGRDRVGPFKKDGWAVWELTADELLGEEVPVATGLACLDRNSRAAERARRLKIAEEVAYDSELERCHASLRLLGDLIRAADPEETEALDPEVEDQLSRLWGLFLEAAGWLAAPAEEQYGQFRERLQEVRDGLTMLRPVTTTQILSPMGEALGALVDFTSLNPIGATTPKGSVLLSAIERLEPATIVLGSVRDRDAGRQALAGLIDSARIVSVTEVREHAEGETVVACSMMARKNFSRFFDPCPADHVVLVAYDFEMETYTGRLEQRRALQARLSLDRLSKERLTGISFGHTATAFEPSEETARGLTGIERIAATTRKPRFELPNAARSESDYTRAARLCRFAGCSWAAFTPNHSLSVLTPGERTALTRRTVDDLEIGDRILLREAGGKDVIRLIAEDIAGPGRYAELWERCERWKTALRAISTNPSTLWQKLSWFGLHRDLVTIRYWLLDEGVIGPRLRDDISIIVEAAGEQPDHGKWDECWDAIVRLRGLHMSAGMQLTQALEEEFRDLLLVDFEHEQAVELSLGLLWLVKVEEIQGLAHWPANAVNHLNWGRQDWREEMLQNAVTGGAV